MIPLITSDGRVPLHVCTVSSHSGDIVSRRSAGHSLTLNVHHMPGVDVSPKRVSDSAVDGLYGLLKRKIVEDLFLGLGLCPLHNVSFLHHRDPT